MAKRKSATGKSRPVGDGKTPPTKKASSARPRATKGSLKGRPNEAKLQASKSADIAERLVLAERELWRVGQVLSELATNLSQTQATIANHAFNAPTQAVFQAADTIPTVPLMPGTVTLKQFMQTVNDLTLIERQQVVEAAIKMLEGLFVHLRLKRSMHGIDPIQRLRLLERRLEKERLGLRMPSSPHAFHAEMIEIFHSLRDLHTNYILPKGYQGYSAFLPFLLQEYFEGTPPTRNYIVTRLADGFSDPNFVRGAKVIAWNGIPIDRAIELVASQQAGSNEDARHARGLESLTLRSMQLDAPPNEDWVIIGYESNGQLRELRMPWMVTQLPFSSNSVDANDSGSFPMISQASASLGYDGTAMALMRTKKSIFFPNLVRMEQQMASAVSLAARDGATQGTTESDLNAATVSFNTHRQKTFSSLHEASATLDRAAHSTRDRARSIDVSRSTTSGSANQESSLLPEFFAFRTLNIGGIECGYIRIYSFMAQDANAFVAEFIRMAKLLPDQGLIIDVRGNGGGNINAGEMLLQVLTRRPITPENFQFTNTEQTLNLCQKYSWLGQWVNSIDMAIETAEAYSQGFPLTSPQAANVSNIWKYKGKSLLIIDSLCYSTTDIFAAGFQDHEIGPILGTSNRTGAGGANVWTYEMFMSLPEFAALPKSVNFSTAIRRSTRVGANLGVPLEDLGVTANTRHFLTKNDLLNDNVDLFQQAVTMLLA